MVYTTLLIDQSGSMAGSEEEVVKVSNRFIEQLGREEVEQRVALTMFEDRPDPVRPMQPIGGFTKLQRTDYAPGGGTALWDSLDDTIRQMTPLVGVENRGVVAVVTDGGDTSSRQTSESMKATMDRLRKTGRWAFFFLALDDAELAQRLQRELGLDPQDVISGSKSELPAAMKQLSATVRGYLNG